MKTNTEWEILSSYETAADSITPAGLIVLRKLNGETNHPYAVHWLNPERNTHHNGKYFIDYDEALTEYHARVGRQAIHERVRQSVKPAPRNNIVKLTAVRNETSN